MLITDPVADMLIRIKNAILAGKADLVMPSTKLKVNIAKLLVDSNYLNSYEVVEKQPQPELKLVLKYQDKTNVITDLKQVSKPGRRIYASAKKLPKVMNGYGISIISTSKGLVTDAQAKKLNVGGEVICKVW